MKLYDAGQEYCFRGYLTYVSVCYRCRRRHGWRMVMMDPLNIWCEECYELWQMEELL